MTHFYSSGSKWYNNATSSVGADITGYYGGIALLFWRAADAKDSGRSSLISNWLDGGAGAPFSMNEQSLFANERSEQWLVTSRGWSPSKLAAKKIKKGKDFRIGTVRYSITGPCLRMRHRPSALRTVPIRTICLKRNRQTNKKRQRKKRKKKQNTLLYIN